MSRFLVLKNGLNAGVRIPFSHVVCQILAALILPMASSAAETKVDPPTTAYEMLQIEGFKVHVSPEVSRDSVLESKVLRVLSVKLDEINHLLSKDQIAKLHNVHFWIEREKGEPGAVFHPSRDWLIGRNYNPDKAGGIELSNAEHFLAWSQTDQPMMVLHELAHAYMFLVLGEDYPPLQEAWDNANREGLYQSVSYVHGGLKRAYALTNRDEFFAELSEAYFGQNDYFPFNINDLRAYDPVAFAMVRKAWEHAPTDI